MAAKTCVIIHLPTHLPFIYRYICQQIYLQDLCFEQAISYFIYLHLFRETFSASHTLIPQKCWASFNAKVLEFRLKREKSMVY